MNLGERAQVQLIKYTPDPEWTCGQAAAACTGTDDWRKALSHSVLSGHESILEHASFTFRIVGISRVAMDQLRTHRLASFAVGGHRRLPIGEDTPFVVPDSVLERPWARVAAEKLLWEAIELYTRLVEDGVPKGDARYLVPIGATVSEVVTMNARELRHVFGLRMCTRAQWEVRDVVTQMHGLCMEVAPGLFQGAGPGCVRGACPELHPCGHPYKGES